MSATPLLVEKDALAPGTSSESVLREKRGRRGALLLGSTAVAVLAGMGGYMLLTRGQEFTDNAQVQADLVPINVRVEGPVLRVRVEDNARVKKGDVLVEIDPREYAVRLAQAEADLVSARAQAKAAEGQLDPRAPEGAKLAVARASAELARAKVAVAESALEQTRLRLESTRVLAPADGTVSKLSVHEGQLLAAGQPVARLVPPRTYVVANFKETQVEHIRPGQRVEVRVDAFPGLVLAGQVESLSGGTGASFSLLPPDNASGNFVKVVQRVPVRVSWKETSGAPPLLAGLSAEVTVFTTDE